MSLLTPWAFAWLGSVPVLVWLWRLASTRQRVLIPSLVPFEHLLPRSARRRTRLVVNLLFWLQLAALLALTLALTQPILWHRRARTVLVVLDTSASMGGRLHGAGAFERAKQALSARVARKRVSEQFFVMTTAPVAPLTPQPTSDSGVLARAVQDVHVGQLGGRLSTAVRVGRALLGTEADETLIITDESPPRPLPSTVRWVAVGEPLPNMAIVGLDAKRPLCAPSDAHVVVTVQNFSTKAAPVTLEAAQRGRKLAQTSADLAAGARQAFSLPMPEGVEGWTDIVLRTRQDALSIDNRAWIQLQPHALPVIVRTQQPALAQTISRWLGACEALQMTPAPPAETGSHVLVTDREAPDGSATSILQFLPPSNPSPSLSYWMVSTDHPIGAYLSPIQAVAAALNFSEGMVVSGVPIIVGLVHGRQVPIVVADARQGRRIVSLLFDPTATADAPPMLFAFFNSLRWVMGGSETARTGQPLSLGGFAPGTVKVTRPDGTTDRAEGHGHDVRYDATTLAGRYRLTQGAHDVTVAVNFIDPLESNLIHRASTWRELESLSAASAQPAQSNQPLANLLILTALIVLLIEWRRYVLRGGSAVAPSASQVLPLRDRSHGPPLVTAGAGASPGKLDTAGTLR